jgi:hypothetical protein
LSVGAFWLAHICCSTYLKDLYWKRRKDEIKEKIFAPSGVEKKLWIHDNLESKYFRLMLLTRCSEDGVLYSPRTNYRFATKENLTVKNNLRKSMLECALSEGNEDKFNPKVAVSFYQVTTTEEPSIDTPPLTSIALETVKIKEKTYENCKVCIKHTTAKHVSQFEYLKLCYILNIRPLQMTNNCKEEGLYDFQTILDRTEPGLITDNAALQRYTTYILRWKSFSVKKELTLQQNIWRVRSFLQTMTGIGISIIEGAHRVTLAAKLLTGMPIDQHIPFTAQELETPNIPTKSPIWGKANVQVLSEAKQAGKTNLDQLIHNETLTIFQEYSQKVAEQKTHFIEATWKDWIGNVLARISQDPHIDLKFDEKSFSQLPEPIPALKNDKYLENYRKIINHVIDSLFDLLPAKRLAEIAKTATDPKKDVDREEFKKNAMQKKWTNYPHQYWAGVSAITYPIELQNAENFKNN